MRAGWISSLARPFRGMPNLRKFFKEMPRMPERRQSGMGSGLVIDKAGLILTNNHVVDGGKEITVRLCDGREYKATKIGTDPKSDLAVLRIQGADNLTPAKLGDSSSAEVGDWVLALGSPFGLEGSVDRRHHQRQRPRARHRRARGLHSDGCLD